MSQSNTFKKGTKVKYVYRENGVKVIEERLSKLEEMAYPPVEWQEKNDWFQKDKVMTNAAFSIHEDLVTQGFDPESDEYYTEIDNKLRGYFPNKFASERPIQTVASAGRKQQGRRTVKLTKSQQAIARRLGVPLEEYAKHVKES